MSEQPTVFTVKDIKQETEQTRLITLSGADSWTFVPGQVAVLGIEGVGESYFAIASAPEDRGGMEFLVKKGKGASEALFEAKKGDKVQAKGPVGKGFPVDSYPGRDFLVVCVGSAVAPMRSVLRSMMSRRSNFGKVALLYGVRYPADFSFLGETEDWKKAGIEVVLTVSRPEGDWKGKTGYVENHFEEVLKGLSKPVALICGMKAMMEQSREKLAGLGVSDAEILTNY